MLKPLTRKGQKVFVILGGLFFAGIVISAWVPQSCPLLRNSLIGCPSHNTIEAVPIPGTDAAELNRVPSNVITGEGDFKVQAQDYRVTTSVSFEFWADTTQDYAYLQTMIGGNYRNIALVTHPLLTNLTWSRIAGTEPTISLYQQDSTYDSVDAILKNLPPKTTLAVDEAAAETLLLNNSEYTPLENLTNLDGISYIISSYIPREPDGKWLQFTQQFDLTNADVVNNSLMFRLYKPENTSASIPFRMSMVHVNYQRMTP